MLINIYLLCIGTFLSNVEIIGCIYRDIHIPGYFKWKNEDLATDVLYCPNCCNTPTRCMSIWEFTNNRRDKCCAIQKAQPFWTFESYQNTTRTLKVRSSPNFTEFVIAEENQTGSHYYLLQNQNKGMVSFPENICEFSTTILINFTRNSLDTLINLSCIETLDTIDLSHNKLKQINSYSLLGLQKLRILDLSYNSITYVEPGAFNYSPRSLLEMYLQHNHLKTIDVSNMQLRFFFYYISYESNQITNSTDVLDTWKGFNRNYGGYINLKNNNITQINLSRSDIIFQYYVNIENNPWICDCFAYAIIIRELYFRPYFRISHALCYDPPFLKGYGSDDFYENRELLDLMICNLTSQDNCPSACDCYIQPSKNRVVINCSSLDFYMMPITLPQYYRLDIDLSHNAIEHLQNRDYLNRSYKIDLSYNRIKSIDYKIYGIDTFDFINLYHNEITFLDESLKNMDRCQIFFGEVELQECSCELLWIKKWLERRTQLSCAFSNKIKCKIDSEYVDMSLESENEICPKQHSYLTYITLPSFALLLFGVFKLYRSFWYETYILYRNKIPQLWRIYTTRKTDFDLYLSFNIDNNDVREWTTMVLTPYLENYGIKVCLPPREFSAGNVQVDQINQYIERCQSFLAILSEDYPECHFTNIEWNRAWSIFKDDLSCHLYVVNFDLIDVSKINERKVRALMKTGFSFDFCNHKNCLLINIVKSVKMQRQYSDLLTV